MGGGKTGNKETHSETIKCKGSDGDPKLGKKTFGMKKMKQMKDMILLLHHSIVNSLRV